MLCYVCDSALSRDMECRRRRILEHCGTNASEWQYKFSLLLSRILPKILDAAYHPSTQDVIYVDDARTAKLGTIGRSTV